MSPIVVLKRIIAGRDANFRDSVNDALASEVLRQLTTADLEALRNAADDGALNKDFAEVMNDPESERSTATRQIFMKLDPSTRATLREEYAKCPPDGCGP
jgi:hypothetical protein